MTTTFNTHAVYSMTPRGSFSTKYEGTDEEAALTAYNKLVDARKSRCFTKRELLPTGSTLATTVMRSEDFPQ